MAEGPATTSLLRRARPEDFATITAIVDDWWGRPVSAVLPRLFLDHFWTTSLVAEDQRGLAGFLVGFRSPSSPAVAYVHLAGVRPDLRSAGLARSLYTRFSADVPGCTELRAITSPGNAASIAFHRRLGFTVRGPVADHDGPGRPKVLFTRPLPWDR